MSRPTRWGAEPTQRCPYDRPLPPSFVLAPGRYTIRINGQPTVVEVARVWH